MRQSVSSIAICGLFLLIGCHSGTRTAPNAPRPSAPVGRVETDLTGAGWRLWMDKTATWEHDELFLPGTDLSKVPTNAPTGGWKMLSSSEGLAVSVPGTVEQYLQHGEGPDGDIKGVSWWYRTIRIPANDAGRRTIVRFDAVRQRAEVYLDGKLVGYDLVGNTPFEADLTDALASDASRHHDEHLLAVRVTDFGGNFDWRDSRKMPWGEYNIPASHGFGGVSGRVRLISCDAAFIDDLYVQNTPAVRTVHAIATIRNQSAKSVRRDALFEVFDRGDASEPVFSQRLPAVEAKPGQSTAQLQITIPDARLWAPDSPNLYVCRVSLEESGRSADSDSRVFGFRWFAPEAIGKDAIFRLNGKRIVLRTAISWGFWPVTGLFPSPELAEKEIRIAKALGQNMLNFHRSLGNPISIENADALGLLIYEEPGGYKTGDGSDFAHALATEKWLRMVKRDRSHPSVVIFCMINEGSGAPGKTLDAHERDMRAAHAIDPSRVITHTSGWAKAKDVDDGSKMHMRPFDDTVYMNGWYDFHHAGGPETWQQKLYKSPAEFYGLTDNQKEIVYWGEEGALSSPPRLEKIKADIERNGQLGWDSAVYLDWYKRVNEFIDRKGLRDSFPTVDALTSSMGNISLYHQGRRIEQMRMNNVADGYAVNGWEAELIDDHSGIVDCYRNPKGDASIMAYYNQPLYVAVKSRTDVVEAPGNAVVDFFAVNERDLHGSLTLEISAKDPSGKSMFTKSIPVTLDGGDRFGQLLSEGVSVPIGDVAGMCDVEAKLVDSASHTKASGHTRVFAVRWKADAITGTGAVWETDKRASTFLKSMKHVDAPAYADALGRLDWAIVTRPPDEGAATSIPADRMRSVAGDRPGVDATFLGGAKFDEPIHQRVDASVDLAVDDGAAPDPVVPMIENYGVRWEGQIVPEITGIHTLIVQSSGGVRLTVDGKDQYDVLDTKGGTNKARIALEKDKPITFSLEFHHAKGAAKCKLTWAPPEVNPPSPTRLLDRVRDDGTTLIVIDQAESWMKLIASTVPGVKYDGAFKVGTSWLGGSHFVRKHPLFADLPVDGAMDWPYQALVRGGRNRTGLLLEGEQLVAGAYHCYPMQIGTAVGVIPYGKGKIIVSTLDICDNLATIDEPAHVARKLLCNFLRYAVSR